MYIIEAQGSGSMHFNEGQGRRAQKDGDEIFLKEFEDTEEYLMQSLVYFSSVE